MHARLEFLFRLVVGLVLVAFGIAAGLAAALIGLRLLISKGRLQQVDPADDELMLIGVGHPITLNSQSRRFRGGRLVNIGGGISLDFSDAVLDPAGGRLMLVTAGGGTEIIVPEDWDVRVTEPTRADATIDPPSGSITSCLLYTSPSPRD